jgi:hypothetical protein
MRKIVGQAPTAGERTQQKPFVGKKYGCIKGYPQKTYNATLFYRGTCIQGRRHLVTAATSVQSCAYRSLCVTIKLDSAAI